MQWGFQFCASLCSGPGTTDLFCPPPLLLGLSIMNAEQSRAGLSDRHYLPLLCKPPPSSCSPLLLIPFDWLGSMLISIPHYPSQYSGDHFQWLPFQLF